MELPSRVRLGHLEHHIIIVFSTPHQLPPPRTHPHTPTSTHAPTHSVLKGKQLSEYPGLKDTCQEMFSQYHSPFLLSLLVDMYEEEAGRGEKESLRKALEVSRLASSFSQSFSQRILLASS